MKRKVWINRLILILISACVFIVGIYTPAAHEESDDCFWMIVIVNIEHYSYYSCSQNSVCQVFYDGSTFAAIEFCAVHESTPSDYYEFWYQGDLGTSCYHH